MSSEFIVIATYPIISFALVSLLPHFLYTRYFQHSKLKISYSYKGLFINYRWVHTLTFSSCAFSVLFSPIIVILLSGIRPPSPDAIVGSVLVGIICLAWAYGGLVGFLNRTTVSVDSDGEITSTYGPLPFFGIPHRAISKVEKIYYKPTISRVPAFPPILYPIWAENALGQKVLLFSRIDSESDTVTVIEELKQHLLKQGSTHIQVDYPPRID